MWHILFPLSQVILSCQKVQSSPKLISPKSVNVLICEFCSPIIVMEFCYNLEKSIFSNQYLYDLSLEISRTSHCWDIVVCQALLNITLLRHRCVPSFAKLCVCVCVCVCVWVQRHFNATERTISQCDHDIKHPGRQLQLNSVMPVTQRQCGQEKQLWFPNEINLSSTRSSCNCL